MGENGYGVSGAGADASRGICDGEQNDEEKLLICRVKRGESCREVGVSYAAKKYHKTKTFFLRLKKSEGTSDEPEPLDGPSSEAIIHLNKGIEVSKIPNSLAIEALNWGEWDGKKFESVLQRSDVTVWVIVMFPRGRICELVVWKEGRSTELLVPKLLGIEHVDYLFPYVDDDDNTWVWAGLYNNTDKLFAEGGLRIRARLFSEEPLKREVEAASGVSAVPVLNPVGADIFSHSDQAEPVTEIAPLEALADEDGAGRTSSALATTGMRGSSAVGTGWRPPLVVIEPHALGGKRVVVNGVLRNEYHITRKGCLEIIEKLRTGEASQVVDKNRKAINVLARFQHEGKGVDGADHELFAKNHLVSDGKGSWRIVAEKN